MRATLAVLAAALACAPAASAPAASAPAPAQTASARGPAAASASHTTGGSPAAAVSRGDRPAPVYRVELVVFRAASALGSPEDWAAESGTTPSAPADADPDASAEPPQPNGGPSGDPGAGGAHPSDGRASGGPGDAQPSGTGQSDGAAPPSVVRLIPSSEFQLDAIASRLRESGRYVPVAHAAWAQTASPWGKPIEIPVQSVGLAAQGITGTVALERGEFLHLALDLRYAMSDPPPGLDAPPGTVFVLDESHRVRLKERNYFDHPAFGIIALVTSDAAPRRAVTP